MLNQLVSVGRIVECIEGKDREAVLKMSVSRPFKNEDGIYENDIIPVILRNFLVEAVKENCKEGDLVGIKARVEADGENVKIIADKLTFLSSKNDVEESKK